MKIKYIVLHHSAVSRAGGADQFEAINNGHKNRNWGSKENPVNCSRSKLGFYVQYHYFIESSGKIKMGRGDDEIGWHSGVYEINSASLAICLAGNFDTEYPTGDQLESLAGLLRDLQKKYGAEIKFHRDVNATKCPGKNITLPIINNLIKKTMKLYIDGDGNQILGDETIKFGYTIPNTAKLDEIKAHCAKQGMDLGSPIKIYMLGWYIVSGTNALGWKEFLNI